MLPIRRRPASPGANISWLGLGPLLALLGEHLPRHTHTHIYIYISRHLERGGASGATRPGSGMQGTFDIAMHALHMHYTCITRAMHVQYTYASVRTLYSSCNAMHLLARVHVTRLLENRVGKGLTRYVPCVARRRVGRPEQFEAAREAAAHLRA